MAAKAMGPRWLCVVYVQDGAKSRATTTVCVLLARRAGVWDVGVGLGSCMPTLPPGHPLPNSVHKGSALSPKGWGQGCGARHGEDRDMRPFVGGGYHAACHVGKGQVRVPQYAALEPPFLDSLVLEIADRLWVALVSSLMPRYRLDLASELRRP